MEDDEYRDIFNSQQNAINEAEREKQSLKNEKNILFLNQFYI